MSDISFPAQIGSHHKWASEDLNVLVFPLPSGVGAVSPVSRVTAVQHYGTDKVISLGLWLAPEDEAALLEFLQGRAAERTEL